MKNNSYKSCQSCQEDAINWDYYLTTAPPAVGQTREANGKLICHNCEIGQVSINLLYRMRN
jgi:hypothetical protein